ncbi:10402_t:CDS:2, partial [Cetraspora pellucida]
MDFGYYRKCKTCKRRERHKDISALQCNMCDQQPLSGNKIIDNWLAKTKGINVTKRAFIEFIPYERFNGITYISEGGFSKIYKATCVNSIRIAWDSHEQRFIYMENVTVNKQISKMDLSFLCSKRILYYQQESAPPSHSNLNIPQKHQLYENNLAYNDNHNKNKRQKYNEDTHYQ